MDFLKCKCTKIHLWLIIFIQFLILICISIFHLDVLKIYWHISNETQTLPFSKIKNYPTSRLIDLYDFQYIINNDVCGNDNIFIITIIHSTPHQKIFRDVIRTTWGLPKVLCDKKIRTVFLLAAVTNYTLQEEIEAENIQFRDIIQGNFIDTYWNLTYKNTMGMKWVSEFCSQARFVLKSDQDIFIELFFLYSLLTNEYSNRATNFLACHEWKNATVNRNNASKTYLSKKDYANDIFDPYCSGWGYVLTPDVAKSLYLESFNHEFVWLDDIHLMGTIVNSIGIKREQINDLYEFNTSVLEEWLASGVDLPMGILISSTYNNHQLSFNLWHKTFLMWLPDMINMCKVEENENYLDKIKMGIL